MALRRRLAAEHLSLAAGAAIDEGEAQQGVYPLLSRSMLKAVGCAKKTQKKMAEAA